MSYRDQIAKLLPSADPRHLEAWMRSEHGTLDALSEAEFSAAVRRAWACIDQAGAEMSEQLAKSYGL